MMLEAEDLSGSPGASYINKVNICKSFVKLNSSLGDVQVYVHPQLLSTTKKTVQHGFGCDLATQPIQATLKFSVWPEWNFNWIGHHLEVLKHYPADLLKARERDRTIQDPSIKTGVENLL